MANSVKLSPTVVLNLGRSVYSQLEGVMTSNKALYGCISDLANGNKGDSYWDGSRAFAWFCSVSRNCCNNYYRVYKIAEFFEKMTSNAADIDFADNDGKYGTGKTLVKLSGQFETIKNSASKNYSTVLLWAQTK